MSSRTLSKSSPMTQSPSTSTSLDSPSVPHEPQGVPVVQYDGPRLFLCTVLPRDKTLGGRRPSFQTTPERAISLSATSRWMPVSPCSKKTT